MFECTDQLFPLGDEKSDDSSVTCFDFHKSSSYIVSGFITGELIVTKFKVDINNDFRFTFRKFSQLKKEHPIRDLIWINDSVLVSTNDGRIELFNDMQLRTTSWSFASSDDTANKLLHLTDTYVAIGYESGSLKIIDVTSSQTHIDLNGNFLDVISDIVYCTYKKTLFVACGDGSMGVFDLRKLKHKQEDNDNPKKLIIARSIYSDDEPLSIGLLPNYKGVVVGTQLGSVEIFSPWNYWGVAKNRLLGHPSSVDVLVPVFEEKSDDEDFLMLSGSTDGMIRLLSLNPVSPEFLAVINLSERVEEEAEECFHSQKKAKKQKSNDNELSKNSKVALNPILSIKRIPNLSNYVPPLSLFASICANNNCIKFWNLSSLFTSSLSEGEEASVVDVVEERKNNYSADKKRKEDRNKGKKQNQKQNESKNDFYSGLFE